MFNVPMPALPTTSVPAFVQVPPETLTVPRLVLLWPRVPIPLVIDPPERFREPMPPKLPTASAVPMFQ